MATKPIAVALQVIDALEALGVLKAQEGRLDLAYLRQWAARLGVTDLLERALSASRGKG